MRADVVLGRGRGCMNLRGKAILKVYPTSICKSSFEKKVAPREHPSHHFKVYRRPLSY